MRTWGKRVGLEILWCSVCTRFKSNLYIHMITISRVIVKRKVEQMEQVRLNPYVSMV